MTHHPRHTGISEATQHQNHTLNSSPESDNPGQCVSSTTTPTPASKLEVPMLFFPAHTVPDSTSSFTSSGGFTTSSSMSSPTSSADWDSESECFTGEASTRSDCQLWLWLPITYNETTLRHLSGRPQVQTLNCLWPLLPDDPESISNCSQPDYRDQEEESPMSCTPHRHSPGQISIWWYRQSH